MLPKAPFFIVKGLLFHTGTPNVHIVDVPTYAGTRIWRSIDDLDVTCWVDARGPFMTVWDIENTRHYINCCPTCNNQLGHGFTIYTDDQRWARQENHTVMSYSKTGAKWKGNILVLRNHGDDDVEDIEAKEFSLVTSMLQS